MIASTLGGNVGLKYSSGLPNALLFAERLIISSSNKGAKMNLSFSDEQNDSYENHNDDPNYEIDSMMLTKSEKQKHFLCLFFFLTKFEPICLLCIPANEQKILKNLENKETFKNVVVLSLIDVWSN